MTRPVREGGKGRRKSRAARAGAPVDRPVPASGAFSWDEHKNARNWSKHAITFETASQVFDDPLHVTSPPETAPDGEQRWQTVGLAGPGLMLLVVYTLRASDLESATGKLERIHIISARRVTKPELRILETLKSERSTQVLGHGTTPDARGWFGTGGYRERKRPSGDD